MSVLIKYVSYKTLQNLLLKFVTYQNKFFLTKHILALAKLCLNWLRKVANGDRNTLMALLTWKHFTQKVI